MVQPFSEIPTVDFPPDIAMNGSLSPFLAETAERVGPIFRCRWRPDSTNPPAYLVGPEANRFVLHTQRHCFSHDRGWTPVVGDWLGHGLLNMDPPDHTRHRQLMNPAFTSRYLAAYLPVMHRVIRRRVGRWPSNRRVDLQAEARQIAFEVAAGALVGLQPGPVADALRERFATLLHGFDAAVETWDEWLVRRDAVARELDERALALIRERRAADDDPRDVLSLIVRARDEDGAPLDDEQVLAHVKILLVAGHETTTSLSAWTLYLLATMPDWLARVREEIAALGCPPDVALDFESLRNLRLLDRFVRETGRLYPPVLQVPRGVVEDCEFAGYQLPAGIAAHLAIGAGHLLPTVFQEPARFDPDRFLPPRDEEKATPYGLITFGGGPRTCIGMSFAQLELKALVAHVLRTVELVALPDQPLVHAGFWTAFVPGGIWVEAR
jgi:cytochrome P450